jgi:hypothetical protein
MGAKNTYPRLTKRSIDDFHEFVVGYDTIEELKTARITDDEGWLMER